MPTAEGDGMRAGAVGWRFLPLYPGSIQEDLLLAGKLLHFENFDKFLLYLCIHAPLRMISSSQRKSQEVLLAHLSQGFSQNNLKDLL